MAASTLAVRPRSPANLSPESHEQNATTLLNLGLIGEQLDPLKVALSGFPDVNTYRAYYEGVGNDVE